MKKFIWMTTSLLLTLAMLAGCGNAKKEAPSKDTEPSATVTEPATEPATDPIPTETQDDTQYEGDASSYYIDVVYAQQIRRYHTAISQQWDENTYTENQLSPLAAHYYEGKPLDNVGFTFMDLDADGVWELIIGAIQNAEQDPLVLEIWTLQNDTPVMVAQSDAQNRYYLQYSQEDELWSVACEAEKGAETRAVYCLQLLDGELSVTQGILFDSAANAAEPWFMTYDLDWDISNDSAIDEETATAIMDAARKNYTAQEYFPYSLYN